MNNYEISDLVQNEQVPDVQDEGYGQKVLKYAKWPLVAGAVLGMSLFGAPKKDMKTVDIQKSSQTQVSENNYAQEALDGIVNGLQSAGVNNAIGGGLDYQSMAKQMKELNKNDKHQKVIDNYNEFADDKGNDSALFYNGLGVAYFWQNNGKKAAKYAKKCLELGGDDNIYYFNLGQAYVMLAKQEDEVSYLRKAIEPFETYLEKGGTTPKNDEYAEKMLAKLQNFKK